MGNTERFSTYRSDDKRLAYLSSALYEEYLVRTTQQMLLYVLVDLSVQHSLELHFSI